MRRPIQRRRVPAGLLALALLGAGCSLFTAQPDLSRFFVLTALPPAADAGSLPPLPGDVSVGLGPIHLPDYLSRPTIVTRTSETEIDPSGVDRWGEPLQNGVQRVLKSDLEQRLGTDRVISFPWYSDVRPTYQIVIDVQRFERDTSNAATLVAIWAIRDATTKATLRNGSTHLTLAAGSPGISASVLAQSETLRDLADVLGRAVVDFARTDRRPARARDGSES